MTGIPLVDFGISMALIALVVMVAACAYRVLRAPGAADRLQAIDAMNTVMLAVIIVLALQQQTPILIDSAVALAAFGFVGTLAIARYISEGRVF